MEEQTLVSIVNIVNNRIETTYRAPLPLVTDDRYDEHYDLMYDYDKAQRDAFGDHLAADEDPSPNRRWVYWFTEEYDWAVKTRYQQDDEAPQLIEFNDIPSMLEHIKNIS